MLIYRLLHFRDSIPDIDVGIEGREKELCKPVVQLFYGSNAQKEVEATLQYFLNLRNEKKDINIEPIIHGIVTKLIANSNTNEIYLKDVWQEVKRTIDGYSDVDEEGKDRRPYQYHTAEYGIIYNKTIASILEHTFGAKPKHREPGNTFTFDLEELQRVGKSYGLKTSIQTKLATAEGNEGNEGNTEECTFKTVSENDNFKPEIKNDNINTDLGDSTIDKKYGSASQTASAPSAPSAPSAIISQVDNDSYFRSRLARLVEKNGDIFNGCELQDSLVGTPAWTEATLLISNAIKAGEIQVVEGEYDTYRIVKRHC